MMWVYITIIITIIYGWITYELITAPAGYEDDNGFHYGKNFFDDSDDL